MLCSFYLKIPYKIIFYMNAVILGSWSENILEYFLRNNQITTEDGAQIIWYHAANHKVQVNEALRSESVFLVLRWIQFFFLIWSYFQVPES